MDPQITQKSTRIDETGGANRLFSILDVFGYLFGASDASRDPQRPPKGSFGGAFAVLLGFFGVSKNEVILVSRRFQALLSKFLQRFSNRQCRGIRCDSSWVPEVCKIFLSTRSAQDGPEKKLRGIPLYPTLAKLGLDAR